MAGHAFPFSYPIVCSIVKILLGSQDAFAAKRFYFRFIGGGCRHFYAIGFVLEFGDGLAFLLGSLRYCGFSVRPSSPSSWVPTVS